MSAELPAKINFNVCPRCGCMAIEKIPTMEMKYKGHIIRFRYRCTSCHADWLHDAETYAEVSIYIAKQRAERELNKTR